MIDVPPPTLPINLRDPRVFGFSAHEKHILGVALALAKANGAVTPADLAAWIGLDTHHAERHWTRFRRLGLLS